MRFLGVGVSFGLVVASDLVDLWWIGWARLWWVAGWLPGAAWVGFVSFGGLSGCLLFVGCCNVSSQVYVIWFRD